MIKRLKQRISELEAEVTALRSGTSTVSSLHAEYSSPFPCKCVFAIAGGLETYKYTCMVVIIPIWL